MNPSDYHYYPLIQNGPYQTAIENIPTDGSGKAYDAAEFANNLLKFTFVDVAEMEFPGTGDVVEAGIKEGQSSVGFVLDNISAILVNISTALMQITDTAGIVDPEYGNGD